MSPLEILRSARALIADPRHWTQGYSARTKDGQSCNVQDPAACKFCAMGAVMRSAGIASTRALSDADTVVGKAYAFLIEEALAKHRCTVVTVNDAEGHGATLGMFDGAIARAEAAEKANSETKTGA